MLRAHPFQGGAPPERLESGLAAIALIANYYRIAADPALLRHQLALAARLAGAEDLVRAANLPRLQCWHAGEGTGRFWPHLRHRGSAVDRFRSRALDPGDDGTRLRRPRLRGLARVVQGCDVRRVTLRLLSLRETPSILGGVSSLPPSFREAAPPSLACPE
jgi:hypothetical protein